AIRNLERSLTHLHLARQILEQMPESMSLSIVYLTLSGVHYRLNQLREAISWAQKALEVAERLNVLPIVGQASANLASARTLTGRVSEGMTALEDAWRLATSNNLAYPADHTRLSAAALLARLKDPRAGLAWVARTPDYRTLSAIVTIPAVLIELRALS